MSWNDRFRHDGTMVDRFDGGWIILTTDESPALDMCPCCQMALTTQEVAQRVADRVYPAHPRMNGG